MTDTTVNLEQYVPVTKQAATEATIVNSVKIGKQLMKSELNKLMANALVRYEQLKKESSELNHTFQHKLKENTERQVRTELANSSEMTRFRNLHRKLTRYTDEPKGEAPAFDTNLSLLREITFPDVLNLRPSSSVGKEVRAQFLAGSISVTVDLEIQDYAYDDEDDGYNLQYLGYTLECYVPAEIITLFQEALAKEVEMMEANHHYNDLERKLKNIDQVAEDMEARLLAKELSKSETGQEALRIAGELVGDMLGEVPALLQSK